MSAYKVVFWDVYGTLIAAHRGDLNSLVAREQELRAAFEQVVHNFGLKMAGEEATKSRAAEAPGFPVAMYKCDTSRDVSELHIGCGRGARFGGR